MKIWKRIGAMAMVTAFSALALTGCGGGSSSGGGDSAGSDGWNIGYVTLPIPMYSAWLVRAR